MGLHNDIVTPAVEPFQDSSIARQTLLVWGWLRGEAFYQGRPTLALFQ